MFYFGSRKSIRKTAMWSFLTHTTAAMIIVKKMDGFVLNERMPSLSIKKSKSLYLEMPNYRLPIEIILRSFYILMEHLLKVFRTNWFI